MAQFIKLATSKALLVPFTVVGGVTVGSAYLTYLATRRFTAAVLSVDVDSASTACQLSSTVFGGVGVAGYLGYRHYHFTPPTLTQLVAQINASVTNTGAGAGTTAAGLPLNGPLQSTESLPFNVIRSVPQPQSANRLSLVYSAVRVPVRFYAVNMLMSAAVLGAGTSIGQRLICGRKAAPSAAVTKSQH